MKKITGILLVVLIGTGIGSFSSCEQLDEWGVFGKKCEVPSCEAHAQKDDIYCYNHRKFIDDTSYPKRKEPIVIVPFPTGYPNSKPNQTQ